MSIEDQTAAGPQARPAGHISAAAKAPAPASLAGARHASPRQTPADRLPGLLRTHWIFVTLIALAAAVRLVAMLGYQPALWYSDSISYVRDAVQMYADVTRPDGYPFFLVIFQDLHSFSLIVGIQHLMGLAIGACIYVVLVRPFRLPPWGAALAAAPSLLGAIGVEVEHFVLSDTLFAFLVALAVVIMMWRPEPTYTACALSGLLLSVGTLVRTQGLTLIVPFALCLFARMRHDKTPRKRDTFGGLGWLVTTFALPLVVYAVWFHGANGIYNLTTGTGEFLYGRVATFADCGVIKPPADERFLCVSSPVSARTGQGTYFVWGASSPLAHGPAPIFTNKLNTLSTDFDIRAIEAQPFAYLGDVWHSTYQAFALHHANNPEAQSASLYLFPATTGPSLKTLYPNCVYACWQSTYAYAGDANPNTRLIQPFAGVIRAYQRIAVLPGPILGLIVLAGLAGLGLGWRRFGDPVLLPWLVGVLIIVTPAATALYDARYVVAALPALCIAAALSVPEIVKAAAAVKARRWPAASGSAGSAVLAGAEEVAVPVATPHRRRTLPAADAPEEVAVPVAKPHRRRTLPAVEAVLAETVSAQAASAQAPSESAGPAAGAGPGAAAEAGNRPPVSAAQVASAADMVFAADAVPAVEAVPAADAASAVEHGSAAGAVPTAGAVPAAQAQSEVAKPPAEAGTEAVPD